MSKKINLNKSDALKDIVDHVVNLESDEITLVVPNFSKISESVTNFKVLKKLSEAMDKKIKIESVDDRVIQLAKEVEIDASNPFFANNRPRRWEEIEASLLPEDKEEALEKEAAPFKIKPRRGFRLNKKYWVSFAVFLALVLPGSWLALNVLPRAEIEIITEKADWQFNDLVSVTKGGNITIETISQKKNAQMVFPANGKKAVNKKASGKITVFNAYSSEAQKLVATTRFATPDGKVIRLAKDLVVPGAKIVDGQISPSSVEVDVVADKAGPEYNIGPIDKLTIPGFEGTPKFAGFYGKIEMALKGGFSGSMAYPTEADIKSAQGKIAQVLEEAINNQLTTQLPADFKTVEGASKFTMLKSEVDTEVNDKGEFALAAEGEVTVVGFKEKDVLAFLKEEMRSKLGKDYDFKNHELNYGIAKVDFGSERLSLPIDFKTVAEKPIDVADLRLKIAGKSETELKNIIFALPGLANATVTLWPFYVSSIPVGANNDKVKIDIK